jgi:hypothetical protein
VNRLALIIVGAELRRPGRPCHNVTTDTNIEVVRRDRAALLVAIDEGDAAIGIQRTNVRRRRETSKEAAEVCDGDILQIDLADVRHANSHNVTIGDLDNRAWQSERWIVNKVGSAIRTYVYTASNIGCVYGNSVCVTACQSLSSSTSNLANACCCDDVCVTDATGLSLNRALRR